jgi:hypothetical protein
MNKPEICPVCGKGKYKYGSGLYDYYTCNHAYEKPLNENESGKFIFYPSPYEKKQRELIP